MPQNAYSSLNATMFQETEESSIKNHNKTRKEKVTMYEQEFAEENKIRRDYKY